MDAPPTAVPHRRGRRTLLIPPPTGRVASWAATIETAADTAACAAVAGGAWLTTRRIDPVTGVVSIDSHPVADLPRLHPDLLLEVRRPTSYVGMRSYIGRMEAPTVTFRSRSVWYESHNELTHLRDLVLCGPATAMATQPMRLTWALRDGSRHHYPDALVDLDGGPRTLIDVTTRHKLADTGALAVFALTASTAAAAGWHYQLRTELPQQRIANLDALRRHRLSPPDPALVADALGGLCFPAQAHTVVRRLGGRPEGLTRLFQLIADRALFVDLDQPLEPDTPIDKEPPLAKGNPSWLVPL